MDVDLPSPGAIAYLEPVSPVIDDKLPAGLVAGIALLWAQILVEAVGGESILWKQTAFVAFPPPFLFEVIGDGDLPDPIQLTPWHLGDPRDHHLLPFDLQPHRPLKTYLIFELIAIFGIFESI